MSWGSWNRATAITTTAAAHPAWIGTATRGRSSFEIEYLPCSAMRSSRAISRTIGSANCEGSTIHRERHCDLSIHLSDKNRLIRRLLGLEDIVQGSPHRSTDACVTAVMICTSVIRTAESPCDDIRIRR